MAAKTLMTVEEFSQMETAETEDYELVEGELVALSSPTPRHGEVRGNLEATLWLFFRQNPLGKAISETDCILDVNTVRRPDISVFLLEKLRQLDKFIIPVPFAPDIAVEVLSPSKGAIEVNRKIRDYLAGSVTEVWVLDHVNRELFIHTRNGIRVLLENDALQSPLLPGFAAQVQDLLAD